MKIIDIYKYLFYKLYKLAELADFKWWSEIKASLIISGFEIILCISISYKFDKILDIGSYEYLGKQGHMWLVGLPISLGNYYYFFMKNDWKLIINKFDKMLKANKRKMNDKLTYLVMLYLCIQTIVILI